MTTKTVDGMIHLVPPHTTRTSIDYDQQAKKKIDFFLKRIVPHPSSSDTTTDKVGTDKIIKFSNKDLVKGKETDDVLTDMSYFDPVWTVISQHTGGSM